MGKKPTLKEFKSLTCTTEDTASSFLNHFLNYFKFWFCQKKYTKCITFDNLEVLTPEQFQLDSEGMARSWAECLAGQVITLDPVGNEFGLYSG